MRSSDDVLTRARAFLWTHARLVERRAFELTFDGGPPEAVVEALRAYRNPDGGFGHALEPDARAPSSQPLFVYAALDLLADCGVRAPELFEGAPAFLESVATEAGAVPWLLVDALEHPRANHWNGPFAVEPSLIATAAVSEWRGRWTFDAVRTLRAYGQI